MKKINLTRRQFLESAFYSSLIYAGGTSPGLIRSSHAAAAPLENPLLLNIFMDGGPDVRHLIVPAYDSSPNSYGAKYWKHRARSHRLSETGKTAQQRWNEDYFPITVSGAGWNGQTDINGLNSGVTFGIWREAGWLIDMFNAGNVAMIANAAGGTNQAHDLCSLMLHQGDVLTELNQRDRSGWGGRLARSAQGNVISVEYSPNPFCFGPTGNAPNYNSYRIDNRDLLSIQDSRSIGLRANDLTRDQIYIPQEKMIRAAKSYYAALRQEQLSDVHQVILDHENKTRVFGKLIGERLADLPVPRLIEALYSGEAGLNLDPATGQGRPVLFNMYSFASQIRNVYDLIAANDVLNPAVMSLRYGDWDSHVNQRIVPSLLATDPNNATEHRGIESGFRDIFGGQYGNNPSNSSALHCGLSALWESLPSSSDKNNIVITVAGEFGRQLRDNGDYGTDHGSGNIIFVIGENCNGGIYGKLFPDQEVDKYDDDGLINPDIQPRTEIDHVFAAVSDWVKPGSSGSVFPRTSPSYTGSSPIIEVPGMLNNLMNF